MSDYRIVEKRGTGVLYSNFKVEEKRLHVSGHTGFCAIWQELQSFRTLEEASKYKKQLELEGRAV